MEIFRQGDILFRRIDDSAIPVTALPARSKVIAYGEATGHAHVADDGLEVYELNGAMYLTGSGNIRHERVHGRASKDDMLHNSITLQDGTYEVIRQREYAPDTIRFERIVTD